MDFINNHPIFTMMGFEKEDESNIKEKTNSLIVIQNSLIFAWDNTNSRLLVSTYSNNNNSEPFVQILLGNAPPVFQVKQIVCSKDNSHVGIVGDSGVCVMIIPKDISHRFASGNIQKRIVCRTEFIADWFFTTNISIKLLQASWHPDADAVNPLLFILSSDNTLRLYNVKSNVQKPIKSFNLVKQSDVRDDVSIADSTSSIFSMYSTVTSLGETAVSFDFGQQIVVERKNEKLSLLEIYILKGNGDVLLLLANLYDHRFQDGIIYGPLIMLPQADDNYGTDSCSILVTQTTPSMIVIGTKSCGKIHHCISLRSEVYSDKVLRSSSELVYKKGENKMSLEPTLYVYETVQLEIIPQNDDVVNDDEYFINLLPDPCLPWRYYCFTSVGVHSVSLPWLQHLNQYLFNDNEASGDNQPLLVRDYPCMVEHLICTKPTAQSVPCIIKGVTITSDVQLGATVLVCLTNDNHCTTITLLSSLKGSIPQLLSGSEKIGSSFDLTDNAAQQQDFTTYVKNLLKHEVTQPILRSSNKIDNDRDKIEMLKRSTDILRDQYITKQDIVRQIIIKRIRLINEQKSQQLEDIKNLQEIKQNLTETAGQIASDYEDVKDKQEMLLERIRNIIKSGKFYDPVTSKAELNMGKELKNISKKLPGLDNGIKQLKIKLSYQEKHIQDKNIDISSSNRDVTTMTKSALAVDQYKQILLEKGDKIHELIKKLNNMNAQVGL